MLRNMAFTSGLPCLCILLFASVQTATSGTIFTDRAAFLAALTDPLIATEDFEGFAVGPIANPVIIMGGAAAIFDDDPEILRTCRNEAGERIMPAPLQMCTDTSHRIEDKVQKSMAPLGNPFNRIARPLMQSMAPLGWSAFNATFSHQSADTFNFRTNSGDDTSALLPASPDEVTLSFIGWVADPGEFLISVQHQSSGLILDNMEAYAEAVPEPASFSLTAIGLLMLGIYAWRGRKRE